MIPHFPLPFPLWGSTFHAELTVGLWRALAAPWLAPGWPSPTSRAPRPAAGGRDTLAASPDPPMPRQIEGGAAPCGAAAPDTGGQVIRVPPARWRQRRG